MASTFFAELKRRNVLRVAFGYVAGAWLLIQVIETLFPVFGLGDGWIRGGVITLAVGFLPALVIAWAFELTPGGLVPDDEAAASREEGSVEHAKFTARIKSFDRLVLVVLALAVAFFAFDKFVLAPEREQALVAGGGASAPSRSVAVLPFLNMSGDPQNEYFSDGLTETLLHMLAQLPDLLVSARTSSFAFKGQNADIREIALALGVAHILEGSVQKARNRLRVTAQLIRAADGFHVWSKNYDRTMDDVFAIQDEIAGDVASALGSTLLGKDGSGIKGIQTQDVDAYDIYLQGLEQQAINTVASLDKAQELFEAALAQDPAFDDAAIALARNYQFKRFRGLGDGEALMSKAVALLDGVLARDADNLAALGLRTMFEAWRKADASGVGGADYVHNLDAAFEALLVLMDRGVGDSYARRWVVAGLIGRERFDDAAAVLRDGLLVDPLNFDLLDAQAHLYTQLEQHENAMQPLLTARKVAPENPMIHWQLSRASYAAGDTAGGLDWTRQAAELDPEGPQLPVFVALNLYQLGFRKVADAWAQRALAIPSDRHAVNAWVVRLAAAAAQTSDERLIGVAKDVIDFSLKDDRGPMGWAVQEYVWAMRRQGRSQEAVDYLRSKSPDIGLDSSWFQQDSQALFELNNMSYELWSDVLEPEEYVRFVQGAIDAFREAKYFIKETLPEDWVGVSLSWAIGDVAEAKRLVGEIDYQRYEMWHDILRDPYLEEFRRDPEVAAHVEKVNAALKQTKRKIAEMLERPEWQLSAI